MKFLKRIGIIDIGSNSIRLVIFDGPIRAIKYALEFQSDIKSLGIECRCGLHIGQIEWRGSDVSGIAINIASRVMNLSKPNTVLITKTLGDLIAGSKIKYAISVNKLSSYAMSISSGTHVSLDRW